MVYGYVSKGIFDCDENAIIRRLKQYRVRMYDLSEGRIKGTDSQQKHKKEPLKNSMFMHRKIATFNSENNPK